MIRYSALITMLLGLIADSRHIPASSWSLGRAWYFLMSVDSQLRSVSSSDDMLLAEAALLTLVEARLPFPGFSPNAYRYGASGDLEQRDAMQRRLAGLPKPVVCSGHLMADTLVIECKTRLNEGDRFYYEQRVKDVALGLGLIAGARAYVAGDTGRVLFTAAGGSLVLTLEQFTQWFLTYLIWDSISLHGIPPSPEDARNGIGYRISAGRVEPYEGPMPPLPPFE